MTWPGTIELACKFGYDGVDLPRLPELASDPIELTRERLAAAGILAGPAIMPVRFALDSAAFAADFIELDWYASLAAAVGYDILVAILSPSSDTPKSELRSQVVGRLRDCAQVLEAHQLKLAVEFYGPLHMRRLFPHEFIWRMDETLAFARECGANVGLLLDSWHWHHSGATYADILDASNSIFAVQIADAADLPPAEIQDMERLVPGEGIIDFNAFFSGLAKAGYDGFVSPEVFGQRLANVAPEDGARLGLESIRAVMSAAGISLADADYG